MTISASLVKELRDKSGAGMMDCKKALTETNGDIEKASEWLRKKGFATAAKKSDRTASEGFVGVHAASDNHSAVLFELNTETDFVSKNDSFRNLVQQIQSASSAFTGDLEAFKNSILPGSNDSVHDTIVNAVAVIGENIQLRRMVRVEAQEGIVSTYVHSAAMPGIGRIAIAVVLQTKSHDEKVSELGKYIAMQIAAHKPIALSIESVDPLVLEKERAICKEQALASGKPENVAEKIAEGRIRKFFEDSVLLEQPFILDDSLKVSEHINNIAKEVGAEIILQQYIRYELGEGIEK